MVELDRHRLGGLFRNAASLMYAFPFLGNPFSTIENSVSHSPE